jgi:predicted RNA binding protein YcfA (HicA-like mRNA interferase family)
VPDPQKTKAAILDPNKDYGHRFADVVNFLQASGWVLRAKGGHHILKRPGLAVLINLQPESNRKAKAYQIRQLRRVLVQFGL